MNLFTLAPKELTNSAIWAWILQSLAENGNQDDPRRRIAEKMLDMMGIPMPQPHEVHEIITEKSMRSLARPGGVVPKSIKRMDVFMRTSGTQPYVLYIENKVAEQKEDSKILEKILKQMEGYHNFLSETAKVDESYCTRVYPAYFGFEIDAAEALRELAVETNSPLKDSLITFPIDRMLEAFAGSGFEEDPILNAFHGWLKSREKFIRFRAAARKKKNVSIQEVIEASKPLGFGHLLKCFVEGLRNCPIIYRHISEENVDTRNINFRMGGRNRATPITLRWYINSGPNGLYVGIHKDFTELLGAQISPEALPKAFAYEMDTGWQFGYLKTEEEVRKFWSGIV